MRARSFDIDGIKLEQIFVKRGLKKKNVSVDCGFEESYFSKAIRSNRMSMPAINLLADRYKIPYDDYKIVEEVETVDTTVEVIPPVIS